MSQGSFVRASGVMAVGTALSRVTGVLRLLALVYAVHFRGLADAYNLANTLPNVVHDVVLGGIVSATFVPVFVSRLAGDDERGAWDAISAVTSVTLVVIGVASIGFLVASPFIVDAMTALNHASQAGVERKVATDLLVLFVPQLACYGAISVATALLNARRRFAAPMFAPIANNLVLVFALVAFGLWVRNPTLGGVYAHRSQLLVLGLGTTAGVMVQAFAMLPSLRRADLHLRWYPRFGHEAVRRILRLSGWTVGLVVTNQIALVVVLALSVHVGQGAVTAYTYAYTFFQLPYGVVAVSIMSAAAPELAASFTRKDMARFRRRMDSGLRAMLAIIVPAAVGMLVLAKPLLSLLGHLIGHPGSTGTTAVALAMLAIGLPGFCVFLYVVRVFQSTQDLRSAFWLYVLENAVNIVGAVALAGPLGVRGIALSISIAYTVAAVWGLVLLRRHVGGLDPERVGRPLGRVAAASVVLAAGAVVGSNLSGSESALGLFGRVLFGTLAGVVGFAAGAVGLAMFHVWRQGRHPTAGGGRGGGSGDEPRHTTVLATSGPLPREPDAPPSPWATVREDELPPGPVPERQVVATSRGWMPSTGRRRRRAGAPPPPERLPPAGRPPRRPTGLGPTKEPGSDGGGDDRGRLDP